MEPSSIRVGTETATAFLHFESTLMRLESRLNVSPTRRSCCWAISYGFSWRWETPASTADTVTPCRRLVARGPRRVYADELGPHLASPRRRAPSGQRHGHHPPAMP